MQFSGLRIRSRAVPVPSVLPISPKRRISWRTCSTASGGRSLHCGRTWSTPSSRRATCCAACWRLTREAASQSLRKRSPRSASACAGCRRARPNPRRQSGVPRRRLPGRPRSRPQPAASTSSSCRPRRRPAATVSSICSTNCAGWGNWTSCSSRTTARMRSVSGNCGCPPRIRRRSSATRSISSPRAAPGVSSKIARSLPTAPHPTASSTTFRACRTRSGPTVSSSHCLPFRPRTKATASSSPCLRCLPRPPPGRPTNPAAFLRRRRPRAPRGMARPTVSSNRCRRRPPRPHRPRRATATASSCRSSRPPPCPHPSSPRRPSFRGRRRP